MRIPKYIEMSAPNFLKINAIFDMYANNGGFCSATAD